MAKCIVTTFIPATDSHGARIRASMEGHRSVVVALDHGLSDQDNHAAARSLLAARLDADNLRMFPHWIGSPSATQWADAKWHTGELPRGKAHVREMA